METLATPPITLQPPVDNMGWLRQRLGGLHGISSVSPRHLGTLEQALLLALVFIPDSTQTAHQG